MNTFKVLNYELTSDKIIANISNEKTEIFYPIDRKQFEEWLAPDGEVEMSFTHHYGNVVTEVEMKEPIADYWIQGEEINNSPVLEHIKLYLSRDTQSQLDVKLKLAEGHIISLFVDQPLEVQKDAIQTLAELSIANFDLGVIREQQKNAA